MKSRTLANGVTLTVVGGSKPEISKDKLSVAFKGLIAIEPTNDAVHDEWAAIMEALSNFTDKCGARDMLKAVMLEVIMTEAEGK